METDYGCLPQKNSFAALSFPESTLVQSKDQGHDGRITRRLYTATTSTVLYVQIINFVCCTRIKRQRRTAAME